MDILGIKVAPFLKVILCNTNLENGPPRPRTPNHNIPLYYSFPGAFIHISRA
ncbi:hypothetical protein CANTEDRAFT_112953 [Yamadazyma tenuis ATCC 10573]|uniref:Uncharacterized protein n=1 Tax=Candida tenuis (strain ATCC 10573 / BCRC 21748 / CBS 615 / JCM 9827 / NBRC 10315 / NRRL Y-1498 / VKM Y-70) TaxID=590646 RepID=G3AZG8_CANTC|nr:uncharacterized protein CANTEDRAFT_112953 [Yamadazyma tenuis ATCC 10573]EGV66091.1 hypothetical protein CANTEDRAFT_112953 [Yamadazyma tenuis ATCC 10573]